MIIRIYLTLRRFLRKRVLVLVIELIALLISFLLITEILIICLFRVLFLLVVILALWVLVPILCNLLAPGLVFLALVFLSLIIRIVAVVIFCFKLLCFILIEGQWVISLLPVVGTGLPFIVLVVPIFLKFLLLLVIWSRILCTTYWCTFNLRIVICISQLLVFVGKLLILYTITARSHDGRCTMTLLMTRLVFVISTIIAPWLVVIVIILGSILLFHVLFLTSLFLRYSDVNNVSVL